MGLSLLIMKQLVHNKARCRESVENWKQHYNTVWSHSSLGYKPPPEATVRPRQNGPTSLPEGEA